MHLIGLSVLSVFFILFYLAFYYGYLIYQCNSVKDVNWPLGVIS